MSARRARFEIVRTDAGWHARFRAANGHIVWTTEVYKRQRAAERAICHLGSPDWRRGHLVWLRVLDGMNGRYVEVRLIDERTP